MQSLGTEAEAEEISSGTTSSSHREDRDCGHGKAGDKDRFTPVRGGRWKREGKGRTEKRKAEEKNTQQLLASVESTASTAPLQIGCLRSVGSIRSKPQGTGASNPNFHILHYHTTGCVVLSGAWPVLSTTQGQTPLTPTPSLTANHLPLPLCPSTRSPMQSTQRIILSNFELNRVLKTFLVPSWVIKYPLCYKQQLKVVCLLVFEPYLAMPRGKLLLALRSGITPGGFWGTIWDSGAWTCVVRVQGKHCPLYCCSGPGFYFFTASYFNLKTLTKHVYLSSVFLET